MTMMIRMDGPFISQLYMRIILCTVGYLQGSEMSTYLFSFLVNLCR
jgi:hypothetical protein